LAIHFYRSSLDKDHSTKGEGGNNRSRRCYGRVALSEGKARPSGLVSVTNIMHSLLRFF